MHCIREYDSTLYVGLARAISHGLLYYSPASVRLVTPHAQRERGKVIDRGVLIIYVCGRKKYLNRTLEIDSPFQTLTVGLLVKFID